MCTSGLLPKQALKMAAVTVTLEDHFDPVKQALKEFYTGIHHQLTGQSPAPVFLPADKSLG